MSERPEHTNRPVGDDGAQYLSALLLAGSLLLLSTPALWIFTTEWIWLAPAVVASLTLVSWWLARQRGWNDQKKHARLLGLALLCFLVAWPELLPTGICPFDVSSDDLPQWLSRYDWLLQLLFWTVCVVLVRLSIPLLHGRRLRAAFTALGFRFAPDEPARTTPSASASDAPARTSPSAPDDPDRTPPSAGKKGFRFIAFLLAACVLLVCLPPQWIGRSGESAFLMLFTLVGSVAVVFLGTRFMSDESARTPPPGGENDSRVISGLLLTACALVFCIPVLCINIPWKEAFLPLAAAAPLTLVSWCLARRWGCARQEAQALFFQRTLLYGLAVFLLPVFQPEIELNGGGMGRVFEALDHLPQYALRLGICGLQMALASHVYARLLWSTVTALTRQPLEFRANCLMGCSGFMLLTVTLLGGIIINTG